MTGVQPQSLSQQSAAPARFAFTGKLAGITRVEAARRIAEHGGQVCADVSRRVTHLVVGMGGWPLLADGAAPRSLTRAEELNRGGHKIRILSEIEFLEWLGLRPPAPRASRGYSAEEICRQLNIEPGTLRRWEQLSLAPANEGLYDFQDLVSLRAIADLVSRGVRPDALARNLHALSNVFPNVTRPLAQLRIIAEGPDSLLAELGDALVTPSGQLLLNFDAPLEDEPSTTALAEGESDASAPEHVESRSADGALRLDEVHSAKSVRAAAQSASLRLHRAMGLEESGRLAEAEAAYRALLLDEPGHTEARFNLANVLRELGRAEEAIEQYMLALRRAPDLAAAWYNLADVYDESGRLDEAIDALRRAVVADTEFADAHFNLALALEKSGRLAEAARHWRAYLQLDMTGEYSEVARGRLRE